MLKQIVSLANRLDQLGMTKEAEYLDSLANKIAKKKKWMQNVVTKEERGKFGEWCKRKGYEGVCQSCINDAAKAGGEAAQMANFAVNASGGKYTYPKKED
jgi:hypothetical protein